MERGAIQKLEDLLLVSVPRDLLDDQALYLRREVLRRAREYGSRLVLLDFSQVDICDSFFGRFIQSMAKMAKLVGARVVISGLQDAVVETLIELGMTLPDIQCVLDLDDAMALSRKQGKGNGTGPQVPQGTNVTGVQTPRGDDSVDAWTLTSPFEDDDLSGAAFLALADDADDDVMGG
jgi:rsbT antagonist protein RsbS